MAKFLVMLLSWFGILYSSQDGHAIYHDYEHFAGQLVALMQLLLWILFIIGVQGSLAQQRGPLQLFLRQLRIYGSVFVLAVPAVVFFASAVIAPYVRHRFVSIGVLVVQLFGVASAYPYACSDTTCMS